MFVLRESENCARKSIKIKKGSDSIYNKNIFHKKEEFVLLWKAGSKAHTSQ